jgi:hypothetical protein
MGRNKFIQVFGRKTLRKKTLGRPSIDGWMLLKYILKNRMDGRGLD